MLTDANRQPHAGKAGLLIPPATDITKHLLRNGIEK